MKNTIGARYFNALSKIKNELENRYYYLIKTENEIIDHDSLSRKYKTYKIVTEIEFKNGLGKLELIEYCFSDLDSCHCVLNYNGVLNRDNKIVVNFDYDTSKVEYSTWGIFKDLQPVEVTQLPKMLNLLEFA